MNTEKDAFVFGFICGFGALALVVAAVVGSSKHSCEKEHNVFKCVSAGYTPEIRGE